VRRKRRYDDYQVREPASSIAIAEVECEPAEAGRRSANLAPLVAAAPSHRLSAPQAGILAQRLGNRSFGNLIARSPRVSVRVSPQDEFASLQQILAGGLHSISSRAAAGQDIASRQAPGGAISAGAPSAANPGTISMPSGASGASAAGINISSSSLKPPAASSLAGGLPSSLPASHSFSPGAIPQASTAPSFDANAMKDENRTRGGLNNNTGIPGELATRGINPFGSNVDSFESTGKQHLHKPRRRGGMASSLGNVAASSFPQEKPHSDVREHARIRIRSGQEQTERDAGQITGQVGQVGTGAPSSGNVSAAHGPASSDVTTAAEREGQAAITRAEPGGRESDLDRVGRSVPTVELEPGTPISLQSTLRAQLQSLVLRSIGSLRQAIQDTANITRQTTVQIASAITSVVHTIQAEIQSVADLVRAAINSTLATVQSTLVRMVFAVGQLVTGSRTVVGRLVDRMTFFAGNTVQWVREQVSTLKRRAVQLIVSLIGSTRARIINWMAAQAVRTVNLIRRANGMIRSLITMAFVLTFKRIMENREQLHRDVERQLGSSSPLPARTRQQYRHYIRQLATLQMVTQANLASQRIRGALMPLSKGLTDTAMFVHQQYTSLVQSFRSTYAEPLRIASAAVPQAASEISDGIEDTLALSSTVAGMSFGEWMQTEVRMHMCHTGLISAGLMFSTV
jgi:hypothetical protein